MIVWLRNKILGKEILELRAELTQAKADAYKAKEAWGEEYRYRQQVTDALYKERVERAVEIRELKEQLENKCTMQ